MYNRHDKVLFFSQAGVGGAERMTVLIGKFLDRMKFDVKFYIVPKGQVSSKITDFIPNDYPVEQIAEASPLKVMQGIFYILRREKPDVVFSSVLYLNNKILPFRYLFPKTKFIIRCENYLFTFSRKQKIMMWLFYRMADYIIAQTEEMQEELTNQLHINKSKVFTLHNPIDTKSIEEKLKNSVSPYPDNGMLHYVASGRFAYQKGFDLLVNSFAELVKKKPNAELYIIGAKDGIHEEEYYKVNSLIEQLGIGEKVHCIGFQKNPYPYIRYADCFVLSSRWEGLPNVLIEALYLGTPVASFKCIPIIERIVHEGKDGYLAEKDNILSLSSAMIQSAKLGRIEMTYKGCNSEDFTSLFCGVANGMVIKLLHLIGGVK